MKEKFDPKTKVYQSRHTLYICPVCAAEYTTKGKTWTCWKRHIQAECQHQWRLQLEPVSDEEISLARFCESCGAEEYQDIGDGILNHFFSQEVLQELWDKSNEEQKRRTRELSNM